MISDYIILTIGCGLGAGLMKAAIDYKDRHLRRETAKTEHYRAQYEQARVSLAYYQGSANWSVATLNNAIPDPPTPPPVYQDIFTQSDIEAMKRGERVVRMSRGGKRQDGVKELG